jgi:tRNA threonylcarbamoyladenosine biosynthesis protein TsaE
LGEKIGRDLKNKVLPKAGSYLNSGKIKPRILCLYGDLGSGKTTFIQGLAKGLGIKKRVISPTFMLIRMYQQEHRTKCIEQRFYHIDLYRINKVGEAKGLGLEEIFNEPKAIIAIEWAERIKEILPKKRIDIYFDYVSENQRKINIIR